MPLSINYGLEIQLVFCFPVHPLLLLATMSYRENTSQRIDISFSMKYYLTFKCKRKGTLRKTRSSLHFSKSLLEALFLMALPCRTKNVGSEKQAEKPGNKLVLPAKLTLQWHGRSIPRKCFTGVIYRSEIHAFLQRVGWHSPTSFCLRSVSLSCSHTSSTLVSNGTFPLVREKLWLTVGQRK